MNWIKTWLLLMIGLTHINSQQLAEVDFLNHYTSEGIYLWNNIIGVAIHTEEYINDLSSNLFEDYWLNSNLNGEWRNNWMVTFIMPKGYIYDCSIYNSTSYIPRCVYDLSVNSTFIDDLGTFVYNTQNQPFWAIEFNNEHYDFTNADFQQAFVDYIFAIYFSTGFNYQISMITQGDKMVENGYRTNYSIDDYIAQIAMYESIIFGVYYVAPGISEESSEQWKASISTFHSNIYWGFFSFECIVFKDEASLTIENLLSEVYTKDFLKKIVRINQTHSYSSFGPSFLLTKLSKIQLIEGDGIDGVTNTFAAAIWLIDFFIEGSKYQFWDMTYTSTGLYQRVFGLAPDFTPTALYYGLLFFTLVRDGTPELLTPDRNGTNDHLKIWGFELFDKIKILILNKDTNRSLSGNVRVQIQSTSTVKMECTLLKANSMESKADQITIGGYRYIGGNNAPQGNYQTVSYSYDATINSYNIPIRYAESALCEIPRAGIQIPTRECFELGLRWIGLALLLLMMMI